MSTSRVKVQIGAFENKSKHPVSTGFSSVALSEESPLLSNGFKFPCELFNPSSAAILSNLLIPTYPLRRKLQSKSFVSRQKTRLVDMEFFVASDLNHLANNILDLAPKVLYLNDFLSIVNSISTFGSFLYFVVPKQILGRALPLP